MTEAQTSSSASSSLNMSSLDTLILTVKHVGRTFCKQRLISTLWSITPRASKSHSSLIYIYIYYFCLYLQFHIYNSWGVNLSKRTFLIIFISISTFLYIILNCWTRHFEGLFNKNIYTVYYQCCKSDTLVRAPRIFRLPSNCRNKRLLLFFRNHK